MLPSAISRPVELLSPAGDASCLAAAMENGADAVYFGLQGGFNARARATNFPLDEVPSVMAALHRRGMKGYVTLNTLIFPDEFDAFEQTARAVAAAGVDAVMVQDIGAARVLLAVCSELPIFASTQMSLTSAEGIALVASLGIRRVVLARELSLEQIAQIRKQTSLELEVFIHGALCISYSGQCQTSLALGGRSANRGQCAQACRMPYASLCGGQPSGPIDRKYPLSPKDLAAFNLLPELIAAGVDSLKIEGRLKSAEYVATVTRCYRRAIDAAMAGKPPEHAAEELADMEVAFSRGFTSGWLRGQDHRELVPGEHSSKRGSLLGTVESVGGERVAVRLAAAVRRGDGVVFSGDRFAGDEQGGRIFEVFVDRCSVAEDVREGVVELAFARDAIDFSKITPGLEVWKTGDPRLAARLKQLDNAGFARRLPIDLKITAHVGCPLKVEARPAAGRVIEMESSDALVAATKHPVSVDVLRQQFGRLGGTSYVLGLLEADIQGGPMAALSVLGKLRRELIAGLDAAFSEAPQRQIAAGSVLGQLRAAATERPASGDLPNLIVLCRTQAQFDAALQTDCAGVIADLPRLDMHERAVADAKAARKAVFLATSRIQKPGEDSHWQGLFECGADGILARNLAALGWFAQRKAAVVADANLNAVNQLSVDWLLGQGANRVTIANDLGRDGAARLLETAAANTIEAIVHQHMPLMVSEHCLFCAGIARARNRLQCGQACRFHRLRLRDRMGVEHLVSAEPSCRNTLYSGLPQTAIEQIPALLARGVRHFRIELPPDEAMVRYREILEAYAAVLADKTTGLAGRKALLEICTGGVARSPLAG